MPANETFSFPSGTTTINTGTVLDQGTLNVDGTATVNISGGLTINGQGALSSSSGTTLDVTGSLLGDTTNVAGFNPQGSVVLDGNDTSSSPQLLEAMSEDLGNVTAGFNNNFAYGTLKLTSNTYVELVDEAANAPGTAPNAVYVNTLVVPSGATLNLNGLHVYALNTTIAGTITGGVISPVTVNWISTASGNWNVGSNWSTGVVPTSNEAVVINVAGATPTITISSGSESVYSIAASDPLSITGGSLTVTSASTISGGLSMTGGSLVASGAGTSLTVTGTTTVSVASLYAEGGATLALPDLTSYSGGGDSSTSTLQASGTGSLLSLPNLASIAGIFASDSSVQVGPVSGGDVELPLLTQSTGPVVLSSASGSGTLDVAELSTFTSGTISDSGGTLSLPSLTNASSTTFQISGGVALSLPTVTNANYANFEVSGGASLTLAGLTGYTGGSDSTTSTVRASGTSSLLSFPNLATITAIAASDSFVQIGTSSGGDVELPLLTQMTGPAVLSSAGGSGTLDVPELSTFIGGTISDAGGTLSLPSLSNAGSTTFQISGGTAMSLPLVTDADYANFEVSGGASLTLAGLMSYTGGGDSHTSTLQASGTGSRLSLPKLATFTGISASDSSVDVNALSTGDVELPLLTQSTGPVVLSTNSGSTLDAAELSTFTGGTVSDSGGTLNLASLTNAGSTTFQISGGVVMSLPLVTSADYANFEVSGGASLTLAVLASYAGGGGFASTTLQASGTGSLLSLPDLATLTASTAFDSSVPINALASGDVELPLLTQMTGPAVLSSTTGSTLDTAKLSTFNGGTINDSGGTINLASLTNASSTTFQISGGVMMSLPTVTEADYANFEVSSGASLTLAGLTSYTGGGGFATSTLHATGTGSLLSLPKLQTLGASTAFDSAVQVDALSSGDVELPLVTQISGPVSLESNGTGSVLDLSDLPSLTGNGAAESLTITQGGTVTDPDLTTFANVTITLDPTATFTVPASETFTFPNSTTGIKTGTVLDQGDLNLQNSAVLNINGGLTINGQGGLSTSSSSALEVSGNLLGTTINAAAFNPLGTVILDGATGTSNPPQLVEAMSEDLGNVAAGYNSNFAYGTLELSANTYAELVDNSANAPGNAPNAIYVNTLIVPSGATLNLNGLHLYAQTKQVSGTITGGVVSPTTVEWTSTTSGSWNVGSNWSTGAVPTSNEAVIIKVQGATPTITISSGSESVLSITASDPLSISGGSLTVAANSTIGGGLSMTGGSLTASGSGVALTVTGSTTVTGASIYAENAATLALSDLTSYAGSGAGYTTTLEATGAGSVLSLPELASLSNPNSCCAYTQVQALAGGDVELPALTQVGGGPVLLEGDGSGSKLNMSALTSFTGDGDANHLSILQDSDGATVMDASLASISGVQIPVTGGTLSFPALTNVVSSDLLVSGGASLTLPVLTGYAGSGAGYTTTLEATGVGSVLSLPELASLSNPDSCCSYTQVQALAGGDVELPALTQVSGGPVLLEADGSGTTLNLSALTTFTGDGDANHLSILQDSDGATVMDADLASISGVSIQVSSGTFSYPALTSVVSSDLLVSDGASLTLPVLTGYAGSGASYTTTLEATGAGSILSLPKLASLSNPDSCCFYTQVEALAGGDVELPALTQVSGGPVLLEADGSGTTLNLSALTSFTGDGDANHLSILQDSNDATVMDADLASISGVSIQVSSGTFSYPALTSVVSSDLLVSDGASLTLPVLTGYAGSGASYTTTLEATGAGSILSLPKLASLSNPDSCCFYTQVEALAGGDVELPALTQVSGGPVLLEADGSGTTLNLSALTSFTGDGDANHLSILQDSNDATVMDADLASISGVSIQVSSGTFSYPALTSVVSSDLLVSDGASLTLPVLTGYAGSGASYTTTLEATGAGSILSLPKLASLSNPDSCCFYTQVEALAGGDVELPALTQVSGGPVLLEGDGSGSKLDMSALTSFTGDGDANHLSILQDSDGATVMDADLASISGVSIQVSSGTFSYPALTSVVSSDLLVSDGASLTLPVLTGYAGSGASYTTTLEATGAGSILSLPKLASLSNPDSCCFYTQVEALAGGDVELPALTQVSGGPVLLEADGSGTTLNLSALTAFTGDGDANHLSILQDSNGAKVLDASLASISGVQIPVTSGALSFPALTSVVSSDLLVSDGASLTLPVLTGYAGSAYTTTLQATGSGSELSLPELASITESNSCCSYTVVQALAGGDVELPVLTQVGGGPVQLEGDGSGSKLDVPALVSLTGDGDVNHLSILQATNTGMVIDPDLTTLNTVKLIADSTGTLSLPANQTFSFTGGTNIVQAGTFLVQGALNVQNSATLEVEGGLTINGAGSLSTSSNSTLDVSGNLVGNTTNAAAFNPLGTVILDSAQGTVNPPQLLEAMSQDLGNVSAGFNSNFAYSTLELTANTYVELVDNSANSPGNAPEAVYVNDLIVPAGATLDLDGLQVYAHTKQINGTIVNGGAVVSGEVYDDANDNGSLDTGETGLSGWTVDLTSTSTSLTYSATTNSSGLFSLVGITAGTYTLSEVVQSGFVQTAPTSPATFTITVASGQTVSNEDFGDYLSQQGPMVYMVTSNADSGAGSLREAIESADMLGSASTIDIAIGTGEQTIDLLSALPAITAPVTIDGTTQPGYSGKPLIELDGAGAGPGANGLTITGDGITVKGLIISEFSGDGIEVTGNDALIQSSYIGTDFTGSKPLGNGGAGIAVTGGGTHNTIGGTTAGAGNVIAGNAGDGIDDIDANSNLIASNWIGTSADGTVALANAGSGVVVTMSSSVLIGGTSLGAGNLISGNDSSGVEINDSTGTLVQGNLIGLDQTGTRAIGNTGAGVLIDNGSISSTVGGVVAGARNFISGNAEGVMVTGSSTAGTLVAGNLIGTNIEGTAAVGNLAGGIVIAGGSGALIGGAAALARNVVSGNTGDGVDIGALAVSTVIQGNFIGTDQTGIKAIANSGSGISLDATGVTIGGTAQGAGNVISGNASAGVLISGATTTGVVILGNRIGTDSAGTAALGNGTFGVLVSGAPGVTIGGTATGDGNIVSANQTAGIGLYADTTGAVVQGNLIGTDTTGSQPLGNGSGIVIDGGSSSNTIGGIAKGAGNTIAFSASTGVDVDATAGSGNEIRLNSIFSNTGLGIDLGGNGVTPNNSAGHVGPNNYQNFPVITAVTSAGGVTTVTGTLNSTPDTTFAVDFYTISSLNASGYGEGRYVLGSEPVTTDGMGAAGFVFQFPNPNGASRFVAATATDPGGNTSEFSQAFGFDIPPTAVIGFTSITVNVGAAIPFSGLQSADPSGLPLTYAWQFGDGATATGPAPTHTYTALGTDTLTLTVSDGFGGMSTATAQVTVVDVAPVFTPNSYAPPLSFTTPLPGSGFGESVASVDGNVAIGAPLANGTGAVYFFDGITPASESISTYSYGGLVHVFADPNPEAGDEFGASLAVVGNELVVGAPGSSLSGPGDGVVYVFDANDEGTTFGDLLATLTIPDPGALDEAHFGAAVGATDTNIVVGAPGNNGGTGEAYEFEGDTTQPSFGMLLRKMLNPSSQTDSDFGAAIAGDGNDVIVGAPTVNLSGAVGGVYLLDGTTGDLITKIANPDASTTTGFGSAVAAVGGNILIGSPDDNNGAGAAFLYTPPATSGPATFQTTFVQPDGGGGNFGASVAATQNTALIGAPGANLGTTDAGAEYLFDANPASPTFGRAIGAVQEPTPASGDALGTAVGFDDGAVIAAAEGSGAAMLYQPTAILSLSSSTTFATALYNSVIVSGTFVDANPSVPLQASINWGDGSAATVIDLPVGSYAFSAPHDYTTNPASGTYTIGVTLTDPYNESTFAETTLDISSPGSYFAPPGLELSTSSIVEGGTVNLSGTIKTPVGTDTNTVTLNWGDGSAPTSIALAAGQDTFSTTHAYLNNPAGVGSEDYTIVGSVTNENGQVGYASASVTVSKVAPQLAAADLSLSETTANEGDTITLGGQFTDPDALSSYTVTIDWGDGSTATELVEVLGQVVPSPTPGLYTFSAPHQYLHNPAGELTGGSYDIDVSVSDGVNTISAGTSIVVQNVLPAVQIKSSVDPVAETITVTADVTDPDPLATDTVAWTLVQNGMNIGMAAGTSYTFSIPSPLGLLVATATATSSDGSVGSENAQIELIEQMSASVVIDASGTTVSMGGMPVSTIAPAGAGEVIALVTGSDDLIDASTDTNSVEIVSSGSDVTMKGGAGDDLLVAGTGANSLVGGSGDDTLVSTGGDDTLRGGTGDTSFQINPGPDPLVIGGSGTNTLDFSTAAQAITINLGLESGQMQLVDSSNDEVTLQGIFNAYFASHNGDNVTLNDDGDLAYATSGNTTITAGSGHDSIVGGSGNDIIYATTGNTTITAGSGHDSIVGGSGNDIIYATTGNTTITAGSGHDSIVGGSGNDIIYATTGNTTISAGSGHDSIVGGSGNDIIYATTGNTTISAGSGHDSIVGGSGNDIIYATTGNTTISAGSGHDSIVGGSGNDIIYATTGNTTITAGSGHDSIVGGSGNDIIYTTTGNSTITGGSGKDSITGGSGNDIIYLTTGNATVTGGSGHDTIVGGSGNDIIYTTTGNSTITGGSGKDSVFGGSGNDIIYLTTGTATIAAGTGGDSIFGGSGQDIIYGNTAAAFIVGGSGNISITGGSGDETIVGGSGNDSISGGSGNVSILGGTGNDWIDGGTGLDTITGGSGDDTITGGAGNDIIVGGSGNDSIVGGSGGDLILGGAGNDIIYGGVLSSTITGGFGNDTIVGGNGNDIIYGGTGNDSIEGGYGAESIVGGSGNDVLIAGNLSSTITGGSGNDLIVGSYGNDSIYGGSGDNTIAAGTGKDSITGGSGNDIIYGGAGDSMIAAGTGNATITAGGGSDVLTGGGFDSWLMFYGSTNMTLTNTSFATSGGSLPNSVSTISGFQHAILAAGPGDFTLDASGFSGSAILQGGTGDDTLIGAGPGHAGRRRGHRLVGRRRPRRYLRLQRQLEREPDDLRAGRVAGRSPRRARFLSGTGRDLDQSRPIRASGRDAGHAFRRRAGPDPGRPTRDRYRAGQLLQRYDYRQHERQHVDRWRRRRPACRSGRQ